MPRDRGDEFTDISPTFARKLRVIRAHASHSGNHPGLAGFFRRCAEGIGPAQGIPLAEAFKRLVPG